MFKNPMTFLCIGFLGVEMLLLTSMGEMGDAKTIIGGFLGLAFPAIYSKASSGIVYTPENSSEGLKTGNEITKEDSK